ncbi:MAG TPA: Spy/CpxP family protein refolding chaperone [Xanthobacteraceae bacterium]
MRNLIRVAAAGAALLMPLLMPLAGFAAPRHSAGEGANAGRLAQMCLEGSRDIVGLPIDQFQKKIQTGDAARAALDELASATLKAAQDLKAACPTETPLSAPGRLAAMQARIDAMIAAVATVRPVLENFFGMLSDEQKEQINTLSRNQRSNRSGSLLEQDCGSAQSSVAEWPTADIDRAVHPTEAQRPSLVALQDAATKAADMSKTYCPAESLITPTARLAAVGKRLETLSQSIKTVSVPLNEFYGMLDDEQKARFNGISVSQSSQNEPSRTKPAAAHRRHYVSLGYLIRRFFHLF